MRQSAVAGRGGHRCGLPALLPRVAGRPVCLIAPAFSALGTPLWQLFTSFPVLWGEVAVMGGDVEKSGLLGVKSICTF